MVIELKNNNNKTEETMCRKWGSHARIVDLLLGITGIARFLQFLQRFSAICYRFKLPNDSFKDLTRVSSVSNQTVRFESRIVRIRIPWICAINLEILVSYVDYWPRG